MERYIKKITEQDSVNVEIKLSTLTLLLKFLLLLCCLEMPPMNFFLSPPLPSTSTTNSFEEGEKHRELMKELGFADERERAWGLQMREIAWGRWCMQMSERR